MNIPITKPVFDQNELDAVVHPLKTGWLVQGPYVTEFENLVAKFIDVGYARATANCTAALHLGLEVLNIGMQDKVVVPSFTYIASANSVEYTKAEVVFCDIDLKTFNIDVNQLENILKKDPDKKIKAVMPVHLFGLCANMEEIDNLAKRYKVALIEDAACALGATINGKHAGTFSSVGCFSFHPRKVITTGEGGMIVTRDKGLVDKISSLRDHGAAKSDFTRHKEKSGSLLPEFPNLGYNYRMTDLQAAIGVAQMKKLAFILDKRRFWAEKYNQALKGLDSLVTPFVPKGYRHVYQSYVCLFTNKSGLKDLTVSKVDALNVKRNNFMEKLAQVGVSTRQGTHAVHTLAYYRKKYKILNKDYFNAYAADRLSVTLPLYAEMTQDEFDYVIEHIEKCVEL